ncbi:hypothetical protein ACIGZJ_31025 [Kitasatospora sp. NPDC052868]|uniref:hypothetical protein n=1 Tax=Kitasatospora sp. NPDC052868 TaxID=3364060 RepID=UPI0037C916CE
MDLPDDFDYSTSADSFADILLRTQNALDAVHDRLDEAQRNADIAALRRLDSTTWPHRE